MKWRAAGLAAAPALAVLAVQAVFFPVPAGVWLQGAVLGMLNAMVVVGLVLVYRANRVVNFAQASMGTLPTTVAGAVVLFGVPLLGRGWGVGLALGLLCAVACGLAVDVLVIARFRRSPRLVVTVATIGLAQLFAVASLLLPRLWGKVALLDPDGLRTGFETPFEWTAEVGGTIFHGAELLAVAVSACSIAAVAAFLHRSDVGIAIRASADRADRALMLGVPVPRLEAMVWVVASVLAFLAAYLQAGILGIEMSSGVGLRVMVAALGAMALGGFSSMPAMVGSAVAIGVLSQATGPAGGRSLTFTDAVLAAVVLVGLLVRKASNLRSERDRVSSWQTTAEPRGLPLELARLPVVRAARVGGVLAVVLLGALVPLTFGESDVLRASTVAALVLVGLSVVVLTGWTGEVTLGQMAFAATGAAVSAYATVVWRFDLTLCVILGGGAAALAAVVVALPSLRRRGIFLAVTTLAFALASINYLLNPTVATWIPTADVERRPLFGVVDIGSRWAMYEVTFAVVVIAFVLVAGIRRTRIGRILRAVRDNPAAAQSYGVRVPLARLGAFALSGFLAGTAGTLMFAIDERYEVAVFSATEGLNAFISAVVGGVGSMLGAVVGVVLIDGARGFLSGPAGLLPSAIGVLVVLMVLPGGVADLLYRARDALVRRFVRERGTDERPEQPARETPLADGIGWLSVRGLDVAYDRVQVIFGVDLDVPKGRITALLGTNGAGKSTLLKAIGGVAPVTAGTITLGTTDVVALRPEEVPRNGIVQMPGGQGVFPSLTVEENLRVATWLFRRDRSVAHRRIDAAFERFPALADRRSDRAADLSGGQQQQLALAMALLAEPDLLLIDELSLGLAPVLVEGLLQELRGLRDRGTTIVVVEQSVNVALTIADHAYFMEKGEIRFSGPAADLLARPDIVRSVYLQGARQALGSTGGHQPGEVRSTTTTPALAVKALGVTFGGIAAVDGVDLEVGDGEIVGLIGPNGAGKTTLFDLISGFTAAESGRVLLHGVDLSSTPPSGRSRNGLGRSFQDARLFPGLTVTETISLALERWVEGDDMLTGAFRLPAALRSEALIAERVDELVEQFGLGAFRSKPVGELSTGSRRMVDLACVIAHQPTVLLLDEPTSGIAQREAEALGPVLAGLRERTGTSLLVIEHDIALVSSLADRLVALDQGRVIASGPPASVLEHPAVIASYLGGGNETLRRSDLEVAP